MRSCPSPPANRRPPLPPEPLPPTSAPFFIPSSPPLCLTCQLISLFEYAWTAALCSPVCLSPLALPWRAHAAMHLPGVGATLLSNAGVDSALPPFFRHSLKNGQLLANMTVGSVLLGKKYTRTQVGGIIALSLGIVMSAAGVEGGGGRDGRASAWVGAICMLGALLLRAVRGAMQEKAFKEHGCHATEVSTTAPPTRSPRSVPSPISPLSPPPLSLPIPSLSSPSCLSPPAHSPASFPLHSSPSSPLRPSLFHSPRLRLAPCLSA